MEPPASGPRGPILVPWPKLKCCDNRDYCNAADDNDDNEEDDDDERKMQMPERTRSAMDREMLDGPANRDATSTEVQPDRKYDNSDGEFGVVRLVNDRVRALHVAALILAVAALISVLASCYVVTRSVNLSFFLPHLHLQTKLNLCTFIRILRLGECLFSKESQYLVISRYICLNKNSKIVGKKY